MDQRGGFKAECYLTDLHQSLTADPGKPEPPANDD